MKKILIAITGSSGKIGYSLIFKIINKNIFKKHTKIILNIIDKKNTIKKLEGIQMEINDCIPKHIYKINITHDINKGFKNANYIILIGSVPRTQNMQRSELLRINGKIFKKQGISINKYAKKNTKILVVGNPCNTNCFIVMHYATKIPKKNFFAMTALDENRAKYQISKKYNTSVQDIHNMFIWGNHSNKLYPDFYNAKIKNKLLIQITKNEKWLKKKFIKKIQNRGKNIIFKLKHSSIGSASHAIIQTIHNLHNTTNKAFSIACCSFGEYNIPKNLIFSFPCKNQNGNIRPIENIKHNKYAIKHIQNNIKELKKELKIIKKLKII